MDDINTESNNLNYKLAFPWLSNGNTKTSSPAAMNSAPLVYTGAEVSRLANIAIIGFELVSPCLC